MKDTIYLKRISLKQIHKRYDLDISFKQSINILHGQNGTGKSTLIHIIANISNLDFIRFAYLDFETIDAWYSDGSKIKLERNLLNDGNKLISIIFNERDGFQFTQKDAIQAEKHLEDERFDSEKIKSELHKQLDEFIEKSNLQKLSISYFPAFRTMLEAWSSQSDADRSYLRRYRNKEKITSFSRRLFGKFLPLINFPTPIEIEENLRDEIRDAQLRIARYEGSVFSSSFVKIFSALLNSQEQHLNTSDLLTQISALIQKPHTDKLGILEQNSNAFTELEKLVSNNNVKRQLDASAANALAIYRDALQERQEIQLKSFEEIDRYFNVVNSFLDKKKLSYELDPERRFPKVGLKFPDDTWSPIRVMSSGERQLLTMLYAVTKMGGNSVVLIDEPELSLHIDWQEELLEKMKQELGGRQIIACTHSPSIATNLEEYMIKVTPKYNDRKSKQSDLCDDEDLI